MKGLILRFDAPLMSFGGVKVDQNNPTERFPGLSMMAGMFANAFGWTHKDTEKIQQLQGRLICASRWDIEPTLILDYQTVDLNQPKMKSPGWTTWGVPEHREGGPDAKFGTHQRYRFYLANGVLILVIALPDESFPDILAVEKALDRPARPLFIGRKTCLPSSPILVGRIEGENVLDMLQQIPRACRQASSNKEIMPACWPADLGNKRAGHAREVFDLRDWKSQLHRGSRSIAEGLIEEASQCS
ncbi:type I-E CRISPR-associated protein Cas5/CasD [Desulfatiglans anilini]|uniref:type I-E CRISPR-associated protein Cas5/CasD n=1 Tax=Desulfatiglans anilini TaxID=90728 RepID=UPI0004097ECA|nr:type I-E CRISPR-associated protein Cas5/CasD [Desulfatiglans anilini]